MIPRRVLHLLLAGSLWGGLAWLLGAKAFGPVIWAGILASPLIGLLVGWITQEAFERLSGVWRGLIVLASVYLGATFFGLAVGIYDWFAGTTAFDSCRSCWCRTWRRPGGVSR
jgi:hypothetical protein